MTLAAAKTATRVGVDVPAHGVGDAPVDNELIGLMKEHGTFYVPTLRVFQLHDSKALHRPAALLISPVAWEAVANLRDRLRRLHEAGAPAAIGTDAGMPGTYYAYATLNEMERFANAGLTPLEAIAVGTSVSARALGIESERGVIAPGMFGDLVIRDGHPEQNIADVEKAAEVFKDGAEIDLAAPKASIASAGATRIRSRPVAAPVDDTELTDGRTLLGTLRVNSSEPEIDHSQMLYVQEARGAGRPCADDCGKAQFETRPSGEDGISADSWRGGTGRCERVQRRFV